MFPPPVPHSVSLPSAVKTSVSDLPDTSGVSVGVTVGVPPHDVASRATTAMAAVMRCKGCDRLMLVVRPCARFSISVWKEDVTSGDMLAPETGSAPALRHCTI